MLAHRLMTWAVFALGALMVLVGVLVISYGIPLVRMEIGWTSIVGGSVAASAGCVVLVLGVLLARLELIQDSLDRLLPVAVPEDLPAFPDPEPAMDDDDREPLDLAASARPLHPLSPAARVREVESEPVQPEPFLPAAAEPAGTFTSPLRPGPDWATEPVHAPEPELTESAPALVHAEEEDSHPPPVEAPDAVADPLVETPTGSRPRPSFLSSLIARRGVAERRAGLAPEGFGRPRDVAAPGPDLPSLADLPMDLSSGWDEMGLSSLPRHSDPEPAAPSGEGERRSRFDRLPQVAESTFNVPSPPQVEETRPVDVAPEPEPEPPAPDFPLSSVDEAVPMPASSAIDPLQPIVVGRYNAGSASYVMFSNGMIQVETEQGTHEFASMQELKVFIERRDAHAS